MQGQGLSGINDWESPAYIREKSVVLTGRPSYDLINITHFLFCFFKK